MMTEFDKDTNVRSTQELIDQLKSLKSLIEWVLPMDYQMVIDEAIEIIGYPLEKERARRKRRKAYMQQYYLEHKEAYLEKAKRLKAKHKKEDKDNGGN